MIITKTPFRISFAGGGTDISDFYQKEDGVVLSTAINKYVYVAIHDYFEKKILLKYSKTELVDNVEEIEHKLIRQCLLKANTRRYLEITSFADIPSSGSGLGSSSAFSVGLLKSLYFIDHKNKSNITLAKEACEVEIDELKEPIGKQDQYACAVGGINLITFKKDGSVFVEPVPMSGKIKKELSDNLLLFYTGITRSASAILSEQKKDMSKDANHRNLVQMKNLALEMRLSLTQGDLTNFGQILHKGWLLKKELAAGITNPLIESYYEKALDLGAIGGKLLGAGGGGFLLFYCEKEKQENLRDNLGLREVKFDFDSEGSRVIYMEDDKNE